ncbi:MAG: hypothetical protein J6L98_01075 [Bacteroidales bacterium]|nr:hypothetical protein [Bacteroidales bacterium]
MMDNYDEGYLRIAEEKLEGIYNLALERARKTVPEAEFVIDARTMDDYLIKVWDYPGVWFVSFSLPAGFDSVESLIETLASETVKYYLAKRL